MLPLYIFLRLFFYQFQSEISLSVSLSLCLSLYTYLHLHVSVESSRWRALGTIIRDHITCCCCCLLRNENFHYATIKIRWQSASSFFKRSSQSPLLLFFFILFSFFPRFEQRGLERKRRRVETTLVIINIPHVGHISKRKKERVGRKREFTHY